MKKIMLIAVCITAGGLLFAQPSNVVLGIKGGVNVASLNVENGVDYNSRASFYAGGLAHIHLTSNFALQPELYFSGQGGKSGSTILKLGYLNIPLLLQYMAGNGFRLQTGPQLGILLSAQSKNGNVKIDVKDNLDAVDFTWAFGASYQFPGSGAGLDARYNLGISNVNSGGNNIQNRVFSLGLFYQFMNAVHKH
ncbi:MAG: porin family protein [Bacteroidota bacterium]|nr:porin family protein [Bacteroidota bacterium]